MFRPCNRPPSKVRPSPKVMLFWLGKRGNWLPMLMPVKLLGLLYSCCLGDPWGDECLLSAWCPGSWVNAWESLQPILPASVVLFPYGGVTLPFRFGTFLHGVPLTALSLCVCLSSYVLCVFSLVLSSVFSIALYVLTKQITVLSGILLSAT